MAVYDLTKGPVGSQLTRMTVPYFLGVSSMILASMIETIYIGILGAKELAAYSFMFPVLMALTGLSMGVGVGASSLIARAEGEGDRERVVKIATHTGVLTLVLTFFLSATGIYWIEPLFVLMGARDEVLMHVMSFAFVWVPGLITFTIPMVSSTVLRALGIAKGPGYVMTITSGLQLVVSPIYIFGLFGFPALGLAGSAWGFITIGVIRIIVLVYMVFAEGILDIRRAMKGIVQSTRDIMHIAIPSMLSSLVGPISMAITIALLAAHSDVIVAAYGIVSRIEMLVTMVLGALSSSIAPFVGQNWGAQIVSRIHEGLRLSYRFCLLWGLVCFAVLAPFGDTIVGVINGDPELISAAHWFLIIVTFSFGLMGMGQVASSVFIALGKPIPPTVLSVLRALVVYVPLAVLFDQWWGYLGIFIAVLVSNVLFGLAAYLWSAKMLDTEIERRGYSH